MDQDHQPHQLPIRFVGSGSEYFRIWIVNLLLTLVTLGLYYPFAKVRRLRYFHGSTEVAGRPLAFHGDPWKMLRGYLLVGALAAVYVLASNVSPLAGGLAGLALAALWPALWRSSMRFRLGNTSWSGLRGGFRGSMAGAYAAYWPVAVPFALFVALGVAGALAPRHAGAVVATIGMLALIAVLLLGPVMLWSLRRYQHNHYVFGSQWARFDAGLGRFMRLSWGASWFSLAVMLGVGVVTALVAGLMGGASVDPRRNLITALVPAAAAFIALKAVVQPYVTARLQNLCWNGTRSHRLGFDSRLRARSLIGVSVRNWLLVLLTLGLYLPFAQVRTARLRLEAVTVISTAGPDELLAGQSAADEVAAGDAAGDLFGIDLGL